MKGNVTVQETRPSLLSQAERAVGALLPPGWTVSARVEPAPRGTDWFLRIRAEDGTTVKLLVNGTVGSLGATEVLVSRLRRLAASTPFVPLLVVPYIGPAYRRACEEYGLNYLDLTGWVWIRTTEPVMFLRSPGAKRDPRPPRPAAITRLAGTGAGRVVRALLASGGPTGVRRLAGRADVTPGTVSKVLKTLATEGVVERDEAGRVQSVSKRALVSRWTQDYQFLRTNTVGWFLAPRGISRVVERVTSSDQAAVATGSLALRRHIPEQRTPVTGLAQLALYVPDLTAVGGLGVVPTDRATANVILAEPYDPYLLRVSSVGQELPVTEVGQTVADLLTLPGRGPEEADQLMDLLAETDSAWR